MKFFSVAVAVAALASSASAVVQNCGKAGLYPYCCDISLGIPLSGFTVGVDCTRAKFGRKTKCSKVNQQKVCCEQKQTTFGPLILCATPTGILPIP